MFLICVLWPLIGRVFLWCAQEEPNREPNSEAAAAETKTGAGDEEGKVPAAAKDEDAGNNLDKGKLLAPAKSSAAESTAPAAEAPIPAPALLVKLPPAFQDDEQNEAAKRAPSAREDQQRSVVAAKDKPAAPKAAFKKNAPKAAPKTAPKKEAQKPAAPKDAKIESEPARTLLRYEGRHQEILQKQGRDQARAEGGRGARVEGARRAEASEDARKPAAPGSNHIRRSARGRPDDPESVGRGGAPQNARDLAAGPVERAGRCDRGPEKRHCCDQDQETPRPELGADVCNQPVSKPLQQPQKPRP
jgi:hypothetical protein